MRYWLSILLLCLTFAGEVIAEIPLPTRAPARALLLIKKIKPSDKLDLINAILGAPDVTHITPGDTCHKLYSYQYRLTDGDTIHVIATEDKELLLISDTKTGAVLYPSQLGLIESPKLPDLGSAMNNLEATSQAMLRVGPSLLLPSVQIKVSNIEYTVATQENKVAFISTSDKAFATPEGATLADTQLDLIKKYAGTVEQIPYWGQYISLPSGWCALFATDTTAAVNTPSPVIQFFKKLK